MILDDIAEKTRGRVGVLKKQRTLSSIRREAEQLGKGEAYLFQRALEQPGISFICEVKRASPSKGIIAEDFPYVEIGREYEQAGAAAISVLTEPYYFMGSNTYLTEIAEAVTLPVLRKDFIIDEYQIFEAKTIGASAVLLIAALLEPEQLKEYLAITHCLGMSALVEAHTEEEAEKAMRSEAKIIGVNNRNLQTFEVDITTSARLRSRIPREIIFVSESGIKTPRDIALLAENHTDAVLIGETLMRSPDKKEQLALLRGEKRKR